MVHIFKIKDVKAAVDASSGSIHILDDVTYDLLNKETFRDEEKKSELILKYGENVVNEAIEEINFLIDSKLIYSEENSIEYNIEPVIKALCLNIAHDCNLKCKYCFASQGNFNGKSSLMPFEVGKKAFDLLVEKSGNRKNLEVDFFGGEPLMNFEVVKKLVKYGREIEKNHNKHFRFTITTNGVLLDDEKIKYINNNFDNVVLSLDGRKEINDRMRRTLNNKGSYNLIVDKFKKLVRERNGQAYFIRGTFTSENIDFFKDIEHIRNLGFDSISVEPVVTKPTESYAINDEHVEIIKEEYEKLAVKYVESKKIPNKKFDFFHFNIELDHGPCIYKRAIGCGAGTEYLAVTPEGHLYPCHQFVGEEGFIIGDVENGITNSELYDIFKNANVNNKNECKDCWAKYYCSGGCHANAYNFNNNIFDPYKVGCELEKKRIECAIMIKAKESIIK